MKKNQSSKSWIIKQHRDPFYKKSKTLGYRSRSAFKLLELNKKFKFILRSTNLLDLGSSPGGWAQIASSIIKDGKIESVNQRVYSAKTIDLKGATVIPGFIDAHYHLSNLGKFFQTILSIFDFFILLIMSSKGHDREAEHQIINEEINLNERI